MTDVVCVPEKFSHRRLWLDVLRHWCLLLKRYEPEDTEDLDFDYWYGAQPLTGLLGSAACMLPDGWSQDELGDENDEIMRFGRGEVEIIIAARIYWVAEPVPAASENVQRKLDEASQGLRRLSQDRRLGLPVSVCYAVPEYEVPDARHAGLKALMDLKRWARSKSLATAKHIRTASEGMVSSSTEYPGVLLVARLEQWPV